jgi:hypothetical protein
MRSAGAGKRDVHLSHQFPTFAGSSPQCTAVGSQSGREKCRFGRGKTHVMRCRNPYTVGAPLHCPL